jgi:hypothetical protein
MSTDAEIGSAVALPDLVLMVTGAQHCGAAILLR